MTPDSNELLALAGELSRARDAYLDAIGRGPGGEVEKRALQELLWNDKSTLIHALQSVAAPAPQKPAPDAMREVRIAKASALARRLCQLFDSGGESQRTVRARHASAIFQLLGSHETEQRQCDTDPVCYLERCERLALSAPVPSPDGAAEATADYSDEVTAAQVKQVDDLVKGEFDTGKWVATDSSASPPSDDVRSALAAARAKIAEWPIPNLVTQANERHEAITSRDRLLKQIDAALRSAPVSAPVKVWTARRPIKPADEDFPADKYWEVLLPDGTWDQCVAAGADDARETMQESWAEAHPETPSALAPAVGVTREAIALDQIREVKVIIPQRDFAKASDEYLAGFHNGAQAQLQAVLALRSPVPDATVSARDAVIEQPGFDVYECKVCGFSSVQPADFKGSDECPLCAGDRAARSTDKPEGKDARSLASGAKP